MHITAWDSEFKDLGKTVFVANKTTVKVYRPHIDPLNSTAIHGSRAATRKQLNFEHV